MSGIQHLDHVDVHDTAIIDNSHIRWTDTYSLKGHPHRSHISGLTILDSVSTDGNCHSWHNTIRCPIGSFTLDEHGSGETEANNAVRSYLSTKSTPHRNSEQEWQEIKSKFSSRKWKEWQPDDDYKVPHTKVDAAFTWCDGDSE